MTQEPQKSNTVLIVVAMIGVIGTIVAAVIVANSNYNIEKFRQEAELTRIALVSSAAQGEETQISITSTPNPNSVAAQGTSTPTAGTDSNKYDDFEDLANNGSFNQQLWRLGGTSSSPKAVQEQGKVTITDSGNQEETAVVLVARNFDGFTIDSPFFFEAELSRSGEGLGNVNIGLYNTTALDWGDWSALCNLTYSGNNIAGNCSNSTWPQQTGHYFETPLQNFVLGTWHKFRVEIDPNQFKITYYIDGIEVGSHIPDEAEALKQAKFQIAIGIWKSTKEGTMLGQFDNINIGKINQ